ncbi:MAG TPA: hypothetical protein VHD56_14705 [Tepidisphaeraceae bacterium]|nr:hypothetical protein [Tepidisphaeraceae bacterium]
MRFNQFDPYVRFWAALLFAFLVPGHGVAAPEPSKPAPIITIIRLDGTSVRGTVTSMGPIIIAFQPAPKPNQPAGTKLDPINLPWASVRSISNGMTHAKFMQQFKLEHAGQLCETCKGEGSSFCSTCKGTGHDPTKLTDCKVCHGELLVDCKGPKCDHGQIPCPSPCLKFSEGEWIKRDDLRVRIWRFGNSYAWISEHHLGNMVTFDSKTHVINDAGKCPLCGGTTHIDCPVCHGSGKSPCPTCAARTNVPACNDCDHGLVACKTCSGSGLKKDGV